MIEPAAASRDHFAIRLAAFYATLGATTGVGMPFFPAFLEYKGLQPAEIGAILAMPMIVRIVFVPLATRLADRWDMWRGALVIGSIGAAIGNASLGLIDGFFPIAIAILLAAVFFTPSFPLADAYALRGLAERGRAYGPIRLWSSVGFIAANVGSGFVVGMSGRISILWLMVASYVVGIALALLLVPSTSHHEVRIDRPRSGKSLWRSPAFVAVIATCSLVQSSHAFYYGFSTLDWTAKGLGDTIIGILWALGVIAEIALFAAVGRLPLGPTALVMIGAAGALVRWGAMALDPAFALLPVLQCLHALSFGATHIGAMQYLALVAPPGLGATVQGDFAAAQAVIFAAAMGLSGVLFRAYGDLGYGAMAILAAVGLVLAVFAHAAHRREGQPHSAAVGG